MLTVMVLRVVSSILLALLATIAWSTEPFDRPAAELTDGELRTALETLIIDTPARGGWQGPASRNERLLGEVVARGGEEWADFVADLVARIDAVPIDQSGRRGRGWTAMDNQAFVIALRRLQGRADPLAIEAVDAEDLVRRVPRLGRLAVRIVNVDDRQIGFLKGGDYRSGRHARWRVRVTDEEGRAVGRRLPAGFIVGGVSTRSLLDPGDAWTLTLDLDRHLRIEAPGRYRLQIGYHDRYTIAERESVAGMFVVWSEPIPLEIEALDLTATPAAVQRVEAAMAEWPAEPGRLRLAMDAPYGPWAHEHIPPESPTGRILTEGPAAIPTLVAALEAADPARRRHILACLSMLTGLHGPSEERDAFGEYHVVWASHGTWHEEGGGLSTARSGQSDGDVDSRAQARLVEAWRRFVTEQTMPDPVAP